MDVRQALFPDEYSAATGSTVLNTPTDPKPFTFPSMEAMVNTAGNLLSPHLPTAVVQEKLKQKFFTPPPAYKQPVLPKTSNLFNEVTGFVTNKLLGGHSPQEVGEALKSGKKPPSYTFGAFWDAVFSPLTAGLKEVGGLMSGTGDKPLEERPYPSQVIAEKLSKPAEILSQGLFPPTREELFPKTTPYMGEPSAKTADTTSPIAYGVKPFSPGAAARSILGKAAPMAIGFLAENALIPNPEKKLELAATAIEDLNNLDKTRKILSFESPKPFVSFFNEKAPAIDLSNPETDKIIKGMGKDLRTQWSGDKNASRVQTKFITDLISKNHPDPVDQRSLFYYQHFVNEPERAAEAHTMLATKDPAILEQNREPMQRALDAIANDKGIKLSPKVAPATPEALPTPTNIPTEVASKMFDKMMGDRTIAASELFPPAEVANFKDMVTKAEIEAELGKTGLSPSEIFGEGSPFQAAIQKGKFADLSPEDTKAIMQSPGAVSPTADNTIKQYIKSTLTNEVLDRFGTNANELLSSLGRKTAGAGGSAETLSSKALADFVRGYFPEGLDSTVKKIQTALESGDNEALASLKFTPSAGAADAAVGGISKETFGNIIEQFDKSDGSVESLSKAINNAFGKKQAGALATNTANKLVKQFGYGSVKEFMADIQTHLAEAEKSGEILPKETISVGDHVGATTNEIRPSRYSESKKIMDMYFKQRQARGASLGYIHGDIQDYINRIMERPTDENALNNLFDSHVSGNPVSLRTQFGQGRKYANILDAMKEGVHPKTDNAIDLMNIYGERDAVAYATTNMKNSLSEGNIGSWFHPKDMPDNWKSLDQYGDRFTHRIPVVDKEGNPQIVTQVFGVPKRIADVMKPILEPKDISSTFQKLRWGQALAKYIDLSVSLFHAKALSLVGLNSMGAKQLARGLRMDLNSPESMMNELDFVAHSGMTTSVDSATHAMMKLRFGEEATAETVNIEKMKQSGVVGKIVAKGLDTDLMRGYNKLAEKTTGLTFDTIQRKYKVWDYSTRMANWIKKNPEATAAELRAAKVDAASLVNGIYGGLNWESGIEMPFFGNVAVSKNRQEFLKSMLLAPDWTISNIVPLSRALKGDAESLKFVGKSIFSGILMTQMTNLALNGKMSEDPWNVTMGIDKTGREIKANLFFAGDIRDVVNLVNGIWDKGLPIGLKEFTQAKAAPFTKTAISMAENIDPSTKQPIVDIWDTPAEKLAKEAWFAASDAMPSPISLSPLIKNHLLNKGDTSAAQDVIQGLGFGQVAHQHITQSLENNYFSRLDQLRVTPKTKWTPYDLAFMTNAGKAAKQITRLRDARKAVGASGAPQSAKYNSVMKIDEALSTILEAVNNVTLEQVKAAQEKITEQTSPEVYQYAQ